jgi:hypothetical protein
MRFTFARMICTAFIGLALVPAADSQDGALSPALKNFVAQYVEAINAKDAARLRALYSFQSQACIATEDKDFYNATLEGLWQEPIPVNHTVTVSAVNETNFKAVETLGHFPAKPTRELHIDSQQGDDVRSVVLYIVMENGRWVADQPCPTAETIKEFHDNAAAREQYKVLAQSIREPLRSELTGLLRKHETASAVDRYHEVSGRDTRTSMLVVNALQSQIP